MASFLRKIPDVTKGLLAATLSISVIYVSLRVADGSFGRSSDLKRPSSRVPYLALVPSQVLYYPWTLFTTTFVEQDVINFLVNTVTIVLGGRYFERAWGSKGLAMTILVTSLIPNVLIVFLYIAWGALTGNSDRANTPCTGGITIQAAFLVAFKQLVPEHTVSIYKGIVKIRVKHFPAIFLLVNTLSGIILGTDTALVFAWLGFLTTWIYLRFYKSQPDLSGSTTAVKGDASETFAFATFFPNVVQQPIAAVSDRIFDVLCAINLCTPFSDEAVELSNQQAASRGDAGLPTFVKQSRGVKGMSKREEAERRRALALRALDQRLNNASSGGPSSTQSRPPTSVTPSISVDQQALGQTDYRPDEN
jgi:membrane associated rhomboid family serine protease